MQAHIKTEYKFHEYKYQHENFHNQNIRMFVENDANAVNVLVFVVAVALVLNYYRIVNRLSLFAFVVVIFDCLRFVLLSTLRRFHYSFV